MMTEEGGSPGVDKNEQAYAEDQAEEREPEGPLVFQCKICRTIVGDTLSFVSTHSELNILTLQGVL